MAYKKPALIELVADLRFAAGLLSQTQLLELATSLKVHGQDTIEFPSQQPFGINFGGIGGSVGFPFPITQGGPKILCWNKEQSRLVQIQESVLSINHVGQYQGWDSFYQLVLKTYEELQKLVPDAKPEFVSLNSVDKFLFPRTGFTLGEYLNCGGPYIPASYQDCKEACDLNMGRGLIAADGHNRALILAARPETPETMVVQFNTIFSEKVDGRAVGEQLEHLHKKSNEHFESMITDATREFMGGIT